MSARTIVLGIAAGSAALALAQELRPGEYEMTVEITLPGAAQPLKATANECLTPDQVVDIQTVLREQMGADEDCTYSEPVKTGNTLKWTTMCDDLEATTELTFTADGFMGTVLTTVEGQEFPAKMTAKRIAATCTPDDDEE